MLVTYFVLPSFLFFFNDTATTEIYTLSLHDALPISGSVQRLATRLTDMGGVQVVQDALPHLLMRSEEHTSELQSRLHLVCRLLLEKKKNQRRHGRVCGALRTHLEWRTDPPAELQLGY